jgi:uncharacterized protein YndB with AHSA1/START domain
MGIIFKLLKWLAILIALLLLIGLFLPAKYGAQRSIVVSAPPEKIQALVDSPKQWVRWSPWNARDPNMNITFSGPERGTGAKWSWISKSEGNGAMEINAIVPMNKLKYTLTMEGMGPPSFSEMTFTPEGGATKVNWRMYGEHGMNPIHRWFSLFMDKLVGPDFETGLKSLKALAEKP